MTYRRKTDANQTEIKRHLERIGYEVLDISQVGTYPDLLVKRGSQDSVFVEIKIEGSAAKWTFTQLRFIADTKFNVIVAKSGQEASDKLRNRHFISQRSKDSIAALLAIETRGSFTPREIDSLLDR